MNDHADPSPPELDALLGAYALDALDPDERAQVDEYLARNPGARAEVDELRETAAALALRPVDDDDARRRSSGTASRGDRRRADDATPPADELAARRARHGRGGTPWISAAVGRGGRGRRRARRAGRVAEPPARRRNRSDANESRRRSTAPRRSKGAKESR